ncbi:hornerin [Drosophila obscura]|uniref:hornerin n=1 Tax=Drosophila obscura TaxID=7282 RepID=UPI000BA14582|nr:hornerin [Drosophila obscura]
MDNLSANNGSKSSSSGSSAASSSMDLGSGKQRHQRGQKKLSRSRSLLQLLSRTLGKHFHHHSHHPQHETVYSSQDDIRSSSTDSFSLSYERGSHECTGGMSMHMNGGSSQDLEEHTSRASPASGYSRYSPTGLDYYDNQGHIYVDAVFRPGSAMEQLHPQMHYDEDRSEGGSSEGSSSNEGEGEGDNDGDNEREDENENDNENENRNRKQRSPSAASASASASKSHGLHLSRISISSSVSRMLQHFSSSAATTANASLRSLSCSSTPLHRQLKKKSLSPHNSNSSSSSSHSSNSSAKSTSSKKDKKQQSILRPPVQYVYMKGMSGLYSRVPSYAVCCPYTLQHMY